MITLFDIKEYLEVCDKAQATMELLKANPVYQKLNNLKTSTDRVKKEVTKTLTEKRNEPLSKSAEKSFDVNFEKMHVNEYDWYKVHIAPKLDLDKVMSTLDQADQELTEHIRNLMDKMDMIKRGSK